MSLIDGTVARKPVGPPVVPPAPPDAPPVPTNWGPVGLFGLSIITLTFVVFGTWAAVARLDSAAIASGTLSIVGNIKTIQHLEGGIVQKLEVGNGSRVKAGDLLIRLDTTQAEASATLFKRQLSAAKASVARLEAEENLAAQISFPEDVTGMVDDDAFVRQAMVAESVRFTVGRDALDQQTKIIDSQNQQVDAEIVTNEAQFAAATDELRIVEERMEELNTLVTKGLVKRTDVLTMERDALNLRSKVAVAASEANRSRQRIAENKLKIVQFQQEYRQTAANALPELRKEIRELERQLVIANDMLKRVEIRSPVNGIVQELKVFTVGAVIQPGEPLMNVSPESDDLVIRANVSPLDADSVTVGMRAEVQFPTFRTMNLLPLNGTVVSRSGDRITDQATGTSYFAVDVEVDPKDVPSAIRDRLGAGMPADVVIPTGERTALNYLVGPLFRSFDVAMRER